MKQSIGMVEITSIPLGIASADAMAKAATVELIQALPLCPGKYLILVAGDVGAVKTAVQAAETSAGAALVDQLVLPSVHDSLVPAISGSVAPGARGALGILETFSCPSILVAADTAAKAAAVDLLEVRLARGLGGKCYLTLTGDVGAVQAAISAAEAVVAGTGFLSGSVVLPAPHQSLWRHVL